MRTNKNFKNDIFVHSALNYTLHIYTNSLLKKNRKLQTNFGLHFFLHKRSHTYTNTHRHRHTHIYTILHTYNDTDLIIKNYIILLREISMCSIVDHVH